MPLIDSSYKAPFAFRSGHLQTIYPTLFRKVPSLPMERERIETPDRDFIDVDWARQNPKQKLAILSHGLEGSSQGKYVQGMAHALFQDGWSILAWNFRGCSGEPNHQLRSYHSGATEDLECVIQHAIQHGYEHIVLVGFSLGGNLTLKYLGEKGSTLSKSIQGGAALSVACDLASSAERLESWDNRIYMRRFLKTLTAKVREKMQRFPNQLNDEGLDQMRTFRQFDGAYTAPIHGFESADDYWAQCSCGSYLENLNVPTLLINALDDPFLTPSCYPTQIAEKHPYFHLETPKHGGHLGFVTLGGSENYWSEMRIRSFLDGINL